MHTDVRNTSIRAYRSEDRTTIVRSIARHILSLCHHRKNASIGSIARALNMDKSSVSGRLNDLKKMDFIILDGKQYKLVPAGTEKNGVTKKTVEMWTMERTDDAPNTPQTSTQLELAL